ncbi:rod-determining factor RdfA [Halomarina litorea]|uniref:rod-determining factor RdfA n=1 Tax=Halomarina litorea TaxID=2961595 RepID=UPI0020C39DA3|nr:rod-determining factor RdfA [Halomarina sp. BCD28]
MRETCKIERLVDRHDLHAVAPGGDVDDYLRARWVGSDGRRPAGYRTLTDWLNGRLLNRVYDERGRETVAGRLDDEYALLTGDDTVERAELEVSLHEAGIDPDWLRGEFLSWSTMRRHLNDCLGAQKETAATTEWERESVRIARDRAREKASDALRSLANKGQVVGGDESDVDIHVLLSCPDCPTRVRIGDALARGYVCKRHHEEREEQCPSN